jgi:tRNA(Ile)-lysidine synthase
MERVLKYIREKQMVKPGDRVIVGVSGGADSVCLLFLLKTFAPVLGITLSVIHIEHGIRGKESQKDADFVENLCGEWNLPCRVERRDIPGLSKEWKCSEEEAGRRVRYEVFQREKEALGGNRIAVAHNRDDQAETILWNLVRGSGLTGLGGIRPIRGEIIRPLLILTRTEIEEILKKEGIPWREDASNQELIYTRNRIRKKILPLLKEELNSQAAEHIVQAGEKIQAAEEYFCREGRRKAERLGKAGEGGFYLQKSGLLQEASVLRPYILREGMKEFLGISPENFSSVHFQEILELLEKQSGKKLSLPKKLLVRTEGDYLVFEKNGQKKEDFSEEMELLIPGETHFGGLTFKTSVEPYKKEIIPEKIYTKWFDYDTIKNTVHLRKRQRGDFLTINREGNVKTLKKYMIDEKIPSGERERICLLADGAHILWIVGYRISEAYKVRETTKRVLKVQIMEETEDGR